MADYLVMLIEGEGEAVAEEAGFTAVKLTPKAIIAGSLIMPLKNLTVKQWAKLHIALQLASEEALMMKPYKMIFLMAEVLELLGFTVEKDGETPGRGERQAG